MPRSCHPRPCHSSQGHGTAWPSREGLWANCPRSAFSGYHAEFREVVIRRIPNSDADGQCETKHRLSWTRKKVVGAHYEKDDVTQFGYFGLPCGLSRRTRHCRSRTGGRHGMCELTHGMAWERHTMCESAFIVRGPPGKGPGCRLEDNNIKDYREVGLRMWTGLKWRLMACFV